MKTKKNPSSHRAKAAKLKRDRTPPPRLKRILVPLDLSGHSREALRHAVPLADKFGAQLILVHVLPPRLTGPDLALVAVDDAPVKRRAATQLEEIGRSIVPSSCYGRAIVAVGHAANEIIATADRIAADMIVMTTHGHGGLKRFLVGSTAEQVVRHAACPVLLVRRR